MTQDPPSDTELIGAILRNGSATAFGQLYARHSPALFRLALVAADGERADAEDLLHDTWIVATQKLATFERRSSLRTWLSGILLNRIRHWRRAPSRAWVELDDEAAASPAEPPPLVERADLERAVASLPPRARLVLILHDAHGHTHEEIALMLGIEPGTSKSQLHRARHTLAARLGSPERSSHGTR